MYDFIWIFDELATYIFKPYIYKTFSSIYMFLCLQLFFANVMNIEHICIIRIFVVIWLLHRLKWVLKRIRRKPHKNVSMRSAWIQTCIVLVIQRRDNIFELILTLVMSIRWYTPMDWCVFKWPFILSTADHEPIFQTLYLCVAWYLPNCFYVDAIFFMIW